MSEGRDPSPDEQARKDTASGVLVVEDSAPLARTYVGYLTTDGFAARHAETGKAALEQVTMEAPDAILLDLNLPDIPGLDVLSRVREQSPDMPVIVVTANASLQVAVEAMRAGADDFLVKPVSADRLRVTVRNALEKASLERTVAAYREQIDRRSFQGFIGSSYTMQAIYRMIETAAPSDATVFITGESGTGKELAAQAIHALSKRSKRSLVTLNCAAIPKDLLESEVFGHVKGAFTGAVSDREGAAGRADKGTLFLDEIGEMDAGLQSKLLRFIQTGTYSRVGSSKTATADIRFVCATNRDPLAEVMAGRFREDLYYRLNVIPVHLPPLRERPDDIPEIAMAFLERFADQDGKAFTTLSESAIEALVHHPWPGNIRELENVMRHAVVMHDGQTLDASMLQLLTDRGAVKAPSTVELVKAEADPGDLDSLAQTIRPLHVVEREAIEAAVQACGGDVRKAAVFLDIAPATIYRKRKAWEKQDGV